MKRFYHAFLILAVLAVGLMLSCDAFAQTQTGGSTQNWNCDGDKTLNTVFCSITTQFSSTPKLLATLAYVAAAVMAMMGLFELKAYGDDPTRTPLRNIVMKFVVATLLISLPMAMQVFITTVTGTDKASAVATITKKPSFGQGVSGR